MALSGKDNIASHCFNFMEYFIGKNGQQYGPFEESVIQAKVAAGEFSVNDLVWREGMAQWKTVHEVFDNPYLPSAVLEAPPHFLLKENQRLAGAGARFAAVLINNLLFLLALIPGGIVFGISGQMGGGELMVNMGIGLMVIGFICLMVFQVRTYLATGQTLGKRQMGVKVVRFDNGEVPGFGGLMGLREVVPALIGMIPFLGTVFYVVDLLFIFREDRRCIHDLMANTKVIVA